MKTSESKLREVDQIMNMLASRCHRSATRRPGGMLFGLACVAAICTAPARCPAAGPTPTSRPNIIVILVDDMGFSDLGCHGGEIPTPHLDALAANGLRFSQCYNTARCCPTRASLLTGLSSHQAGVGHMTDDEHLPGYRGRLNDECVTIAEVLGDAGYFTCMAGKWHVGQNHGVAPWNRGFQRSVNPASGGFYYAGSPRYDLSLDGEQLAADDPRLPTDWYTTDLWTTFGLTFIDEARAAGKPFFLYLAHNAPHFPLQAPAAEIEKFRGRYTRGWDALARERFERQKTLGLVDPRWTPAARPEAVAAWDTLSPEEQDRFDHLMAVYAATVHLMDRAIGNLVHGLRDRGLLDDTLILFMSDNGGNAESGPAGRSIGDPTKADSTWFCGESWAFLQNVPFRKSKHFVHEGGIATPLIAHWPTVIADRGAWRPQPAHVIDIMPTCLEVASATYPEERGGRRIQPAEGRSLVPAFRGEAVDREAIYWEHEGNAAVRVGDLKLVRAGRTGAWELYDLAADRTEQHDLAAERPAEVAALAARWQSWAERVHAEPAPERPKKKR
jgi:arylsulfatase A-like enzyme